MNKERVSTIVMVKSITSEGEYINWWRTENLHLFNHLEDFIVSGDTTEILGVYHNTTFKSRSAILAQYRKAKEHYI